MPLTAVARSIETASSPTLLMLRKASHGLALSVHNDEPWVPMGCSLSGDNTKHVRTGPFLLEKTGAHLYLNGRRVGREYIASGNGWEMLRRFAGRDLPNVCVLDALYKFSSLAPDEWRPEENVFFGGTVYGVIHRPGTVFGLYTNHILSLSRDVNGAMHWNTHCLNEGVKGKCYLAVIE